MNEFNYFYDENLSKNSNHKINLEIIKYAGMYLLKQMDLSENENKSFFEIPLTGLDEHLEVIFDDLMFHNLININIKKARYELTKEGQNYINSLIIEIESYINKYQKYEPFTRIKIMQDNGINPLRARFLWGLYDGEFDDFAKWQIDMEIEEKEQLSDWRQIITNKNFYDILFEDIIDDENIDDEKMNNFINSAKKNHQKNSKKEKLYSEKKSEYFNPNHDANFWYTTY